MAFSFPYKPVYDVASWEKTLNKQWQQWLKTQWNTKQQNKNTSEKSTKPVYTIIMPPPNVTGSLHLGHALSSYLQSLLIRLHAMRGYDVLWVPGLDHASIAVQMMVEKELLTQGIKRQDLDRETFLKHAWVWKEKHGHRIVDQMKAMGFCAQWEALCFTLDSPMNHGVNTAFKILHDRGLIYRAQRLVHWDVQLETAVSDLEVANKTEKGFLWTLQYTGEGDVHISVGTSRPETLFGDQAIAVHPKDERYVHLVGKKVRIPLTKTWIPIISDYRVQPDKGTGAVKITPAHDPLDYLIGKDNELPMVTILTPKGAMASCPEVPETYWGLDRFAARKKILEDLSHGGHLLGEEAIVHSVPYSDRSQVIIEPRLTHQWFLNVEKIAAESLDVVEKGKTQFFPDSWKNTYDHWLKNIQPWCISRQLWWGHRLPVWYLPNGEYIVALNEKEALEKAMDLHGPNVTLRQEDDVLDTWFSSALWPLTTLGWPGDDGALKHSETGSMVNGQWKNPRYPTDVLVTGFDILFFWVARMMMMGLNMTEDVPFRHVVLHPLIQDEKGQKMSKTKNNVIDPMAVVEACGVDTMGFALISALTDKMHCPFGQKNLQEAHLFMTKFWNLFRFLTTREAWGPKGNKNFLRQKQSETLEDVKALQPEITHGLNHWLLREMWKTSKEVERLLGVYEFHEALLVLKSFTWNTYCDWYVELGKWFFTEEMRDMFTWSGGQLLRLWHPFIPFITEKLWRDLWDCTHIADGSHIAPKNKVEKNNDSSESVENTGDIFHDSPGDSFGNILEDTREEGDMPLETLWNAAYPSSEVFVGFSETMAQGISWLQQMISWTRSLRLDFSLGKAPLTLYITELNKDLYGVLQSCEEGLRAQGGLTLVFKPYDGLEKGVAMIIEGVHLFLPMGHLLDLEKETKRLEKQREKVQKDIQDIQVKLQNDDFISKAPLVIREGLQNRLDQQLKALRDIENFQKNLGLDF